MGSHDEAMLLREELRRLKSHNALLTAANQAYSLQGKAKDAEIGRLTTIRRDAFAEIETLNDELKHAEAVLVKVQEALKSHDDQGAAALVDEYFNLQRATF